MKHFEEYELNKKYLNIEHPVNLLPTGSIIEVYFGGKFNEADGNLMMIIYNLNNIIKDSKGYIIIGISLTNITHDSQEESIFYTEYHAIHDYIIKRIGYE